MNFGALKTKQMADKENPLDDNIMLDEIIKIKRQGLCDVVMAIKILLIVGDRSYLNKTEKHNLKIIENASNTLIESLKTKFEKK